MHHLVLTKHAPWDNVNRILTFCGLQLCFQSSSPVSLNTSQLNWCLDEVFILFFAETPLENNLLQCNVFFCWRIILMINSHFSGGKSDYFWSTTDWYIYYLYICLQVQIWIFYIFLMFRKWKKHIPKKTEPCSQEKLYKLFIDRKWSELRDSNLFV